MVPHESVNASGSSSSEKQTWDHAEALRVVRLFILARAADLARAGDYQEAEGLLRSVDPADLPIAGLDLLARICAQQGRLEEAQRWWQEVLAREPENGLARSALARLAKEETPAKHDRGTRHGWWERVKTRFISSGRSSPSLAEGLNIHVPGVILRRERAKIRFTFDFPLFENSEALLTEDGKKALARLGWQLEPYVGKIAVEIIGQPDCLPDSLEGLPSDVSALGMARAFAVFNHLVQTTKLQARMFSLRTGDDFLASPSNDRASVERSGGHPVVILQVRFLPH